jgi:hypothetical protein
VTQPHRRTWFWYDSSVWEGGVVKHQRNIKNLLISPTEQLAFGFRILLAPLMVVMIMSLTFLQPIINESKMITPFVAPEHRMDLDIASSHQVMFLTGTYIIAGLYLLAYVVVVSHRIFGPMISIRNYVKGLINGVPQGDLVLRTGDYFHELAVLLTELNRKIVTPEIQQSKASS